MTSKEKTSLVMFLKEKGLSPGDIRLALTISDQGELMTKAIYKFNYLYDKQEIDGFPESAIEVLESVYGRRLRRMKAETLIKKVTYLQRCITDSVDHIEIHSAVSDWLTK